MKKNVIAILLAVVMIFTLASCDNSTAEASKTEPSAATSETASETATPEAAPTNSGKLKIGMVVKAVGDPFWINLRDGAQAKADELGVELIFNAPNAETDIEKQINMVQDLISSNVDALCIAPSQADSMENVLQTAGEKGIPVLWVDTAGKYDKALTFIGTGNEEAGYVLGKYMSTQLEAGSKVVFIRNSIGDPTGDERCAGFERGLKENNIEVIDTKPGIGEAESMNVMMDMIQTHEDIDAVLTVGGYMAKGAYRAIEQAGKTEQIKVATFDGLDQVEMLEDGSYSAAVVQNPAAMGSQAVELAVKVANGETIEERVDTGVTLITPENVAEYLAANAK